MKAFKINMQKLNIVMGNTKYKRSYELQSIWIVKALRDLTVWHLKINQCF
jgi:hypothetical protein